MSRKKCDNLINDLTKAFEMLINCLKEYEAGELEFDTAEFMMDVEFGVMWRLMDEYLRNRKVENEQ